MTVTVTKEDNDNNGEWVIQRQRERGIKAYGAEKNSTKKDFGAAVSLLDVDDSRSDGSGETLSIDFSSDSGGDLSDGENAHRQALCHCRVQFRNGLTSITSWS